MICHNHVDHFAMLYTTRYILLFPRVLFLPLLVQAFCLSVTVAHSFRLSYFLPLSHSTCRKTDIPQLPVFRYFIIMTDNHLEEHFLSFQNKSLKNMLSLQAVVLQALWCVCCFSI